MLYPGGQERMFLAAVDVRGAHKAWGRRRAEVDGLVGHAVPQGPRRTTAAP